PETYSAIGEAGDTAATETLKLPADVVKSFGGLHVDLASTALVGLGEGARYLVEYPYGCAEQRGSRALALLLSADLGEAFKLPGIDPAQLRPTVQATLKEIERFQGEGGGVRVADLRRRIANAVLPEAATAHVEELNDPYLMWFWNSNVRTTAIVLRTLVNAGAPGDTSFRPMVAWLMQVRKNGRWG